jgi:predicted lipid-binding transport protein (Tim44 family)
VVRGPRVRSVTIEALDAHAEPPRMTVAVEAEGRRYVEDRDTARVVSGDPSKVTRFIEQWTLALDGDDANPWRIVYLIRNGRRARVG